MKLFNKKKKAWFKPFKKKAAKDIKPPALKLLSMTHNRLAEYAERIGIGVCSQSDNYATELAQNMMDVLHDYNCAIANWQSPPKGTNRYKIHETLLKNQHEICRWLKLIANHFVQTKRDYIKHLNEAGFEMDHTHAPSPGNLPVLRKRKKQL